MRKAFIIIWMFSFGFCSKNCFACTIFYISRDGKVFAGNNEDWEDPGSMIWFYPSSEGSNDWIKFGWGSGFPQGGVNDKGLFWDATSCS